MKKNDIILIVTILIIAIGGIVYYTISKKDGADVVIYVDGEKYETLELNKDQEFSIKDDDGTVINTLVIEDNAAYMKEATCPDHICIYQAKISKTGESIVCLPHQVVIMIEDGEQSEIDSVAN